MKKFIVLFIVSCNLFIAYNCYAKSNISPSIKIYSYKYTKNNDINLEASGSATVITKDGLILTNNHVIENPNEPSKTYDGFLVCLSSEYQEKPECEYTASFIARNKDLDIAILQIDNKNIRGKPIPKLNYLEYDHTYTLKEGDTIQVLGYPGIGGESITTTKGQVSGFEEYDNIKYIKTDTDISNGNSGGTALNKDGVFVGIPTYVVSSLENLGYLLDIHEAKQWINVNKFNTPIINEEVNTLIREKNIIINDAKEKKVYNHPYFPSFQLTIPSDWVFYVLERNVIIVKTEKKSKNYSIGFHIKEFPFDLTEQYLKEAVFEKFEKNKEFFLNYERKHTKFKDKDGFMIKYNNAWNDTCSINYVIPVNNIGIIISYEYDLKENDKDIYENVLKEFMFNNKIPPQKISVTLKTPDFQVKSPKDWYILKNLDPKNEDLILELLRPDNFEGKISLSNHKLSKSDKSLPKTEYLKNLIRSNGYIKNFKLVNKNSDIKIDGLDGVSITYTYQGEDLSQTRKTSEIHIFDNDHFYEFVYDDLDNNYDTYLDDFKFLCRNFQTKENKGIYELGSLNYVFFDISYHRYEQSISNLKDKNIIEGFLDNTFKPEKNISRLETLKIILDSKKYLDDKQNNNNLSIYLDTYKDTETQIFADTTTNQKYLKYAKDNNIIKGYNNNTFHPEKNITLSETLKILFRSFEIPVWDSSTSNVVWYKPYMDKSIEIGVLPVSLYNADHQITRGELAYIIDKLINRLEQN